MRYLTTLACAIITLSGCNKFDPKAIMSEPDAWLCINSNKYDSYYKKFCDGKSIEITAFVKEKHKESYVMDKDFIIISAADRNAYISGDSSKLDYNEFKIKPDKWLQPGNKVRIQGYMSGGDVRIHSLDELHASGEEAEQFNKWSRNNKISKLFSAWDGSLPSMVRQVKTSLKDPDSFEHISTKYIDNGKNITVIMQYRAINSFGAKIPAVAIATVSESGSIIQLNNPQ